MRQLLNFEKIRDSTHLRELLEVLACSVQLLPKMTSKSVERGIGRAIVVHKLLWRMILLGTDPTHQLSLGQDLVWSLHASWVLCILKRLYSERMSSLVTQRKLREWCGVTIFHTPASCSLQRNGVQ